MNMRNSNKIILIFEKEKSAWAQIHINLNLLQDLLSVKFKNHLRHLLLAVSLLLSQTIFAQINSNSVFRKKLMALVDSSKAVVGIGIIGLDFRDSLAINGNKHFPMQSVFKFPLAMVILNKVDKGMLSLSQVIHISQGSLDTNTWSPMLKDFPKRNIDMTLSTLLAYAVSKSDNNACDILFRFAGGTTSVNKYIHSLGLEGIAISATEAQMKKAWEVQYTNWCQPATMLRLLRIFYEGKILSKTSNDLLMKLMTESENSPNRLKGLLPATAIVAHKTGTSNTNKKGLTAATNDIGIVTLPNGRHYAIVVYVSDYKGGVPRGEHIIATISKLVWDHYTTK